MGYPGGKAGAGVYQAIINQIPPHDTYIEPFLGDGAILRRKRPARRSCAVESDGEVLRRWKGDEIPGLELYCCDGIEWLKHHFGLYRYRDGESNAAGSDDPGSRTLVYCDPPYLLSTRSSGPIYRHEFTEAQHLDLLEVLKRLPCRVAISGYWSNLYAEILEDWRPVTFQATNRAGRQVTEWLWCDYPQPTELHDYRFLGRDKREREKLNRRARNWIGGLHRMPPIERQALVAAITGDHL